MMTRRRQEVLDIIVREINIGMHQRAVANEENLANQGRPPKRGPSVGDIANKIFDALDEAGKLI